MIYSAALWIALLGYQQEAAVGESTPVSVRLDPAAGVDLGGIDIEGVPADADRPSVHQRIRFSRAQGTVTLPVGFGPQITCRGSKVWCPTIEVGNHKTIDLPIYARSEFDVTLVPPRSDIELPTTVTVQGRLRLTGLSFETTVTRTSGGFVVNVPATPLDLRFATASFAPIYVFDVSPLRKRKLGPFALVEGGSISGFTRDAATQAVARGVNLDLSPAGPIPTDPHASPSSQFALQVFHGTTDKDGFFQFVGISPGRYRLDMRSPAYPTHFVEVEVPPESETYLDRVDLPPFASVTLVVHPPVDLAGQPWRLSVLPRQNGARKDAQITVNASHEGIAGLSRVAPGPLLIEIFNHDGARLGSRTEEVSGDTQIDIDVPMVRLQGRVRRGALGVEHAEIALEAGYGDRTRFVTDDRGEFEGYVRRPQSALPIITVQIYEEGLPGPRPVKYRLAEPSADPLRVDINLGENKVSGTVIDAGGQPVDRAKVQFDAVDLSEHLTAVSVADGSFDFVGVPKGTYVTQAKHTQLGISARRIMAVDDDSSEAVVLQLAPWRSIEGEVRSSTNAPVPAAELWLHGDTGDLERAVTDATGHFTARLPPGIREVVAQVFAPSQMLWSACTHVTDDGRIDLRLPAPPGIRVNMTLPDKEKSAKTGRLIYLFTANGGFLGLGDLFRWRYLVSGGGDRSPSFPGLAAGAYAVSWEPLDDGALVRKACSGAAAATWHSARQGADLELRVPSDSSQTN